MLSALLIDDHDLFREGLKSLLREHADINAFFEAKTLAEGLQLATNTTASIITLDLNLPDRPDGDSVSMVKAMAPASRLIVVSATEDSQTILAALAAGAHGYVPKRLAGREAGHAVRQVLEGRVYVPDSVHATSSASAEKHRATADLDRLSPRQRDVVNELALGSTTKIIAHQLNLSEGTVKLHLSAIYRILGCNNRAQAVALLNRIDKSRPGT